MEKVIGTALALALCACGNIEGLRSQDIYGLRSNPEVWVHGLVTNARTGAPLPGVSIEVAGVSTTSNGNGAYRLDGLEAVETTGSASVHGFQTSSLTLNLQPGPNRRDIALQPQECGRAMCAADQFCDESNGQCVEGATLSGSVVNSCDGAGLDVRVTIDGKSVCSSARTGKAYFLLTNIRPGGPHVIAFGKPLYKPLNMQLTLTPGLNAMDTVSMEPQGGCAAGLPAYEPCTCTDVTCQ